MTVRDLISQSIDVDVYDDMCEALSIAFCGPLELTEAGMKKFWDVLDYEIEFVHGFTGLYVVVKVDNDDENTWIRRLKKAKEFFESAAGYCADRDFKQWFREVET